jgi:hypothetical protein
MRAPFLITIGLAMLGIRRTARSSMGVLAACLEMASISQAETRPAFRGMASLDHASCILNLEPAVAV